MSEKVFSEEEQKILPSELVEKLELEVPKLFDHLVRMTGSINRAKETTEEVLSLMKKVKKEVPYVEIRVALYSLARKLNKSYWNTFTEKLINNGFTGNEDEENARKLESLLGKLDGQDREKILLKHRLEFADNQIAKVMGLQAQAHLDLGSLLEDLGVVHPEEIKKIPNHPVPTTTLYQTKALSEVMLDFETKKRGLSFVKQALLIGLVIVGIGLAYLIWK